MTKDLKFYLLGVAFFFSLLLVLVRPASITVFLFSLAMVTPGYYFMEHGYVIVGGAWIIVALAVVTALCWRIGGM